MMRPLVIVGTGVFARETAAVVAAINAAQPTWDLIGFLDDDERSHGEYRSGHRVLGETAWLGAHEEVAAVICAGAPVRDGRRAQLIQRLRLGDDRLATIVHPSAEIRGCRIGAGSVIGAGAILTTDVRIGRHVAVLPTSVLSCATAVGERSVIGAGSRLLAGVSIGDDVYIGAGCTIRQQMSVGDGSVVSMGSVVVRSVPAHQIWSGHPAQHLRDLRPSDVISTSEPYSPETFSPQKGGTPHGHPD